MHIHIQTKHKKKGEVNFTLSVGTAVGTAEGVKVGTAVGFAIGVPVGAAEGESVGFATGAFVGKGRRLQQVNW